MARKRKLKVGARALSLEERAEILVGLSAGDMWGP